MSERTFKVTVPHMRGKDIEAWQEHLNGQMKTWRVDYRLLVDGDYGPITRDLTASVCHGFGLASASSAMARGVTPQLRIKLRNKRQTEADKRRFDQRAEWRKAFRARMAARDLAAPLGKILTSSHGFKPGHDGVDLICNPRAAGLAICKAKVVRVSDDWWGIGNPGGAVGDRGDGIVVLRSLVSVGRFKKGMNFGYGHAERPRVRVGETVEAGQVICEAGLANAWHFHFMVNSRRDVMGVGDRDPMPFIRDASA